MMCVYVCVHVCMYAYMHICVYVCMYVCMHACIFLGNSNSIGFQLVTIKRNNITSPSILLYYSILFP